MEAHHINATTGEDELSDVALALALPPAKQAAKKPAQKAAKFNPKKPETWGKVARNDECPCGSGKRYKHCHGAYV